MHTCWNGAAVFDGEAYRQARAKFRGKDLSGKVCEDEESECARIWKDISLALG